jgi:hypothetical protein
MKPFNGFSGFAPMNQIGGSSQEPPTQPDTSSGGKVFDQILQQMQAAKEGQKTAMKSKVDMLWPMGTAMKGKI